MKKVSVCSVAVFSILLMSHQQTWAKLGDYVRLQSNGKAVRQNLSQADASDECEKAQSRLPSIYDLAKHATKHGAVILSEEKMKAGEIPVGHYIGNFQGISYVDAHNEVQRFFYDRSSYHAPKGNEASYWLWSSSIEIRDPTRARFLHLPTGAIQSWSIFFNQRNFAARCIQMNGGD